MDEFPNIDTSALQVAANSMHEIYTTLCKAGFNSQEALYLTGVMVMQNKGDDK